MNTHTNPILAIIDSLQNESLHMANAALVAGALAMWQKLSTSGEINEHFAINEDLFKTPDEAAKRLRLLSEHLSNPAFDVVADQLQDMHPKAVSAVLRMVALHDRQGLLSFFNPTDLVLLAGNRRELNHFPVEICDLLIDIAEIDAFRGPASVYLPWEPSGQLLGRALDKGASVSVECSDSEAALFADIAGASQRAHKRLRIQHSDPITTPMFTVDGGLEKFNIVIACPPFNAKVATLSQKSDPFGRFPDDTNSLTVLAIRHAIAQSTGRVIVVTSNSLLFSAGAERRLRRELVGSGQVDAVIALPAGLLSNPALAISVLVLRQAGENRSIKMIDCDNGTYKKSYSRTRFTLDRVKDIANLVNQDLASPHVFNADIDAIAENEWNLMPSRYVQAADMIAVERLLSTGSTHLLGEVAEIIRPAPSSDIVDCEPALEVGAADIFDNGFISQPSKAVIVADWRGKGRNQFLKPLDIVIVIKGSIGKVSIAPEHTPPPGPGGWVVGQSVAIIRTFRDNDPHQLAVFLRSAVGQEQIRRIAAGTAIPFLQMRELRLIRVPVENPTTSAQARQILDRQESLRKQIAELEAQLKLIKYDQWELPVSQTPQ